MLDRLAGKDYYCFLDGYSGYNHIAIAPEDQEKNDIHMSLWYICILVDAIWTVQCTSDILAMHDGFVF